MRRRRFPFSVEYAHLSGCPTTSRPQPSSDDIPHTSGSKMGACSGQQARSRAVWSAAAARSRCHATLVELVHHKFETMGAEAGASMRKDVDGGGPDSWPVVRRHRSRLV